MLLCGIPGDRARDDVILLDHAVLSDNIPSDAPYLWRESRVKDADSL
jgi:hypothetical protein